jgi:site-specific DNA-methyltransferase (cytosine-N4-specific)
MQPGLKNIPLPYETIPSINNKLQNIDWTFKDSFTCGQTHGIHPYPAKFIPQIPSSLISELHPKDGTGILDPFCGSGTTLVESLRNGIPAVGIDLHPLACLLSKVKVTPLSKGLSSAAKEIIERAHDVDITPPEIPALDHWFQKDIQHSIASIKDCIDRELDKDVRDALCIALSSIIVRVSNQDSDTRYAAVKKNINAKDVFDIFYKSVKKVEKAISNTWDPLFPPPQVDIINKNILSVTSKDIKIPISLVITSPPYPNKYEYWLYHKYRMYWLGMDPIAVRNSEIGARPLYFKRKPQTAKDFEDQMSIVFKTLYDIVIPGGHACFQVGNSIIRGEKIDNAQIITRAANKAGFKDTFSVEREIPPSRKTFNPDHTGAKEEYILIFQR